MSRILIVEDELGLSQGLSNGLTEEGYAVDVAGDGKSATTYLATRTYDLVILDLLLPDASGIDICRWLRRRKAIVPVIMLTARDTVPDIILGLDSGADDYVTKPFSFDELLARVRSLLRRRAERASAVIEIGPLRVDTLARRVFRGKVEVNLTRREYQVLEHLALHLGRIVPKSRLMQAIWEDGDEYDDNLLEVHVASLRKKLGRQVRKLILTIRGQGYSLRNEST